jgi:carbonic anhydrase
MGKARGLLFLIGLVLAAGGCGGDRHPKGVSAEEALKRLAAGNERYATAKLTHPDQSGERREAVAKGQRPFAAVLGCADSRVPPELLFDQGLGDLFVVRIAGNIADDSGLGSLEYAVEHLGVRLILVLGHERCGAVQAALAGGEAPGHLGALVRPIQAAIARAPAAPAASGDPVDRAVDVNIQAVVAQVRSSPLLAHVAHEKKLQVRGARYDLDTGRVVFFP